MKSFTKQVIALSLAVTLLIGLVPDIKANFFTPNHSLPTRIAVAGAASTFAAWYILGQIYVNYWRKKAVAPTPPAQDSTLDYLRYQLCETSWGQQPTEERIDNYKVKNLEPVLQNALAAIVQGKTSEEITQALKNVDPITLKAEYSKLPGWGWIGVSNDFIKRAINPSWEKLFALVAMIALIKPAKDKPCCYTDYADILFKVFTGGMFNSPFPAPAAS